MGIYDRDYYRDEPRGFRLGAIESAFATLIVINVVAYLVDVIGDGVLSTRGALHADLFSRPWNVWQLLSYGFLHDQHRISHIFFNMLVLWFFGREVEAIYGRREFFRMFLTGIVLSGLCWVVVEWAAMQRTTLQLAPGAAAIDFLSLKRLVGASGAISAVVAICVLHYPHKTILLNLFIPVPLWVAGVLWLAQDIFGAMNQGQDNVAYTAHLAGAAYGFVFFKTRWHFGKLLPSGDWFRQRMKPQPKLRVVDPEQRESELNEEADRILEKIARSGQGSLTPDERRTLERYSERMKQKRR